MVLILIKCEHNSVCASVREEIIMLGKSDSIIQVHNINKPIHLITEENRMNLNWYIYIYVCVCVYVQWVLNVANIRQEQSESLATKQPGVNISALSRTHRDNCSQDGNNLWQNCYHSDSFIIITLSQYWLYS